LAEQIATILGDDTRRAAMARRSRELATARFDVDHNARETLAALKRIAGRG
jgi:hypothetical protein